MNDLKGSAAFYSRIRKPFRGCERAYPETTGYIIETLLDYHKINNEDWLLVYALSCADWLVDMQLENGDYFWENPIYNSSVAAYFSKGVPVGNTL